MKYGIIFTKEEIKDIKINYEHLTKGWELYCGANCEECPNNKICIKIIEKINKCINAQDDLKTKLEEATKRKIEELKNK